jgi:outer membrane protein OmpA-like peptidoglycan-associated protein
VEEEFDVYFELGATDLTPEATLVLQRVGQRYAECELSIITIEGHADSDGPEQINMEISRQRAEAVGDVLLDMNIETERLRLVPLGESRALNSDGEKRPLNRKTVVRIVP